MDLQIKHHGQVFTPEYLADRILDTAGYAGPEILRRHCIDNSCGDGAFLCRIAERYAAAFRARNPDDTPGLKRELETCIHGIERDEAAYAVCRENLRRTEKKLGLPPVNWHVLHTDALTVSEFDGRMDFVVGNPPYVRVHHLNSDYHAVKQFRFAREGMTDLFLVFFELGFRMLSANGRLCYITPSSWINSLAGKTLRQDIRRNGTLSKLIDLQHFQPFKASTYTMISLFEKGKRQETFLYSVYDPVRQREQEIARLRPDEAFIDDTLYLATPAELRRMQMILNHGKTGPAVVKNGFATLADSVFIRDSFPFSDWLIPVIKASTGQWKKAFFPYDAAGKPLSRDIIFRNAAAADYLNARRDQLLKGRPETAVPDWFLYGRTQALKDVCRHKYAVGNCIRSAESIKFNPVPPGSGVYGGLYILSGMEESKLRAAVCSESFMNYVRMLKKYKSGGYYTFNTNDLERYLNAVPDGEPLTPDDRL